MTASPTRRLVAYMLRYRRGFALGLACTALSTVASLTTPWVLKHAVDDLAQGVTGAKLRTYAALILALALIGGAFRFLMRRIIVGLSRHLEYDLRNAFFARLQERGVLPWRRRQVPILRAGSEIVALEGSFHGRTMGSLSFTSSKYTQQAGFFPTILGVLLLGYLYLWRNGGLQWD